MCRKINNSDVVHFIEKKSFDVVSCVILILCPMNDEANLRLQEPVPDPEPGGPFHS